VSGDEFDDDRTRMQPPARSGAPVDLDTSLANMGAGPARPDRGNALAAGTQLGGFELLSVLGEGGFGIVYLARDAALNREVAIKEYMPSTLAVRGADGQVRVRDEGNRETFEAGLRSFVNEARLLAQFDHPSLVKVYRFWEALGTACMVMPFYKGQTLRDTLRSRPSAPDEAWLRQLLLPLTEALAVIHARQCLHRDIAPDNIMMLSSAQRPLLLDFGAARRVIVDMTQALTVILKPGYAPVEQYADIPSLQQGPWTDVYALAAVVHHAITGRTPPPSVGRLVNDTYLPLVGVAAGRYSRQFLATIDRALSVRPDNRQQSIEQLREELDAAAPRSAPAQQAGPPGSKLPHPSASSPGAAAGAVDDALMERAAALLALHLGPIARVVVRRSAERTRQRDAFYALLVESAPEPVRAKLLSDLHRLP